MALKLDDSWIILQDILQKEGIARQHLNSYDEFIDKGLQSIVDEVSGIEIETVTTPYKIKLGKLTLGRPQVVEIDGSLSYQLPLEARLRNVTYSVPIFVEMQIEEGGIIRDAHQGIHIGNLPVMVKSRLCPLRGKSPEELIQMGADPQDPGGYFIINGSERVIIGLEDLSPNRVLVDIEKAGAVKNYKAKIYSSIVGYRSKLEITLKQDGSINVKVPSSPVELPFVIILRALGLESDKEVADLVSYSPEIQDLLDVSFDKALEASTQKDALTYIGNRVAHGMLDEFRIRKAESLLDWGLLPHLGKTVLDRRDKAAFIGEAICKVLELKLGWIKADDKDHYGNKVIKFAGQMVADLFRTAFRNLVRDIKYQLERSGNKRGINVVIPAIRPGIITDKLNNSIATGNWGRGKVGVTQLLDRINYLSILSHLRRIQSPLSRSQPNFEARDLHPTHWGRVCPNETPEGSNCGLVKNLALSALISVNVPQGEVINSLIELGVSLIWESDQAARNGARVFVDGRFIGFAADVEKLAKDFRSDRRQGMISPDASICVYTPEESKAVTRVYVGTSSGRVIRPLIIVEDGKSLLTEDVLSKLDRGEVSWKDLVQMGIIEFIDANEEENCFISIDSNKVKKAHT
ncbi:MAG: DNA-directed RNA polymerase subunit B'', partial [Nitrososphaerales archaeon]